MEINLYAILAASFTALIIGYIWYNPKVFGNIWIKESGLNLENRKGVNLTLLLITSFIYAFLISIVLEGIVIHQNGVVALVGGPMVFENAKPSFTAFMTDYKDAFRTFKHGALHGFITGLFLALPIVGTISLYERRSYKYVLIVSGYWIVSFTIMGGIICAWR